MMTSARMPGSGSGPSAGIIVFGWLNQAPPVVDVADNRLTQNTTALVYSGLNYQFAKDGLLALPAGLIPGTSQKFR